MNGIRASVLDLSPIYQEADPHVALQQSVLLAQIAEALGYTRYWVSEHHDMPQFASSTPEVLLAHIGAKTSHIRVGSGAVLLPNYRPYKVGEAFALLATLYPGRIDLGIGRAPGGSAHASLAISGNFLAQVGKMGELVGDLSAILWNEFTVEGQPVIARPTPPVPAQLWMLGTNRKSAELAANYGTGYVFGHFMSDQPGDETISYYREQFRVSRHHEEPQVIIAVSVYCAASREEASKLISERETGSRSRKMMIGTPEQLTPLLQDLVTKFQADELMIITDIPDYEKRLDSYKRLARSVFSLAAPV
ncbi:MAG: MsnO8 family class oxidoreductase [Brevibacillus sp.]|jgi:luciferase family oxidoreductase group 1|nr:MsnO8 family class oxidoreductase [Brevibacillus sp.]